jgi:predicted DCC family thiol-disulfide oxidoreductase YuxK
MNEHPVILFDGVCNFCNTSINFLIKLDKKDRFRFSPLQSEFGQVMLKFEKLPPVPNSFILIVGDKWYEKSSATLKIFEFLPWYWKWTKVFWLVPKFIRDGLYEFVSKRRYKWFGKKDRCMIPTPEVRKKFL